ncbi:MAG TPA: DUF305 domain-containing protein [Chloroflexota bacterium]
MSRRHLLGALGLLVVVGCTSSGPSPGAARVTPVPETAIAATAGAAFPTTVISSRARVFDQQFIDTMVPHHQLEIELARVALTRAQHDELRALAEDLIESETDEVRDMQAWRGEWFGSPLTPPMGGAADIDALKATPDPFDVAFIDALLPLAQQAIELSNRAVLEAGQQNVLDVAGAILESHSRYSLQMQAWRKDW